MQERCPGWVYLIKRLCKILNGRGQISSACVGLVGERMREKPKVSYLDKNVLFVCCDRVMIGFVITKQNYKDNQCTAELV